MTKFSIAHSAKVIPEVRTKFTRLVRMETGVTGPALLSPDDFDEVEFIGSSTLPVIGGTGFFRCRDTGNSTWAFFIGVIGEEFRDGL